MDNGPHYLTKGMLAKPSPARAFWYQYIPRIILTNGNNIPLVRDSVLHTKVLKWLWTPCAE